MERKINRRYEQRPHQQEAVHALLKEFAHAARATAIKPCGAGKTLVALWTAEGLHARTIVVFEPTRALVQQTIQSFRSQVRDTASRFLAVSSDKAQDESPDDIHLDMTGSGVSVTTDPGVIRDFLVSGTSPRIIVTTYHSAHQVHAALGQDLKIDFGVFDEAHKTAGAADKAFAQALSDDWLAIKRRLFLTATPRHTEINAADDDRFEKTVFSMDDEAVYGKKAYVLTYRDAVDRGIILPFRVVIAVVTADDVARAIHLEKGVHASSGTINARAVAQWVALRKTMNELGLKKAFAFHDTVAAAQEFAGMANIVDMPECRPINALHINGEHSAVARVGIFSDFERSDTAIVTNARCLTEGVDVPAVDLVAFNSSRRSVTDIVQAVGRSQRHAPGKKAGYVLLPVFADQKYGESIEDTIERAELGEVGVILHALAEQNNAIIDSVRLAAQSGRKGGDSASNDDHDDVDRGVDFRVIGALSGVDLESITRSIAVRVVRRISTTWDDMYQRLQEDVKVHGHGWFPKRKFSHVYEAYPDWASKQRKIYHSGKMPAERIVALERLGFPWSPERRSKAAAVTNALIDDLKHLNKKHDGKFDLYRREHELSPTIRDLLSRARVLYRNTGLNASYARLLNEHGMIWDTPKSRSEKMVSRINDIESKIQAGAFAGVYTYEALAVADPDVHRFVRDLIEYPFYPSGRPIEMRLGRIRCLFEPHTWADASSVLNGHPPRDPYWLREIIIGIIHRQRLIRLGEAKTMLSILESPCDPHVLAARLKDLFFCLTDPDDATNVLSDAAGALFDAGFRMKGSVITHHEYKYHILPGDASSPPEFLALEKAVKDIYSRHTGDRLRRKPVSNGRMRILFQTDESLLPSVSANNTEDRYHEIIGKRSTRPNWAALDGLADRNATKKTKATKAAKLLHPDNLWMSRFNELKTASAIFGHANIPRDWPTNPGLALWLYRQREKYRSGKLDSLQIEMLTGIGVALVRNPGVWKPDTDRAARSLHARKAYDKARSPR